MVECLDKYFYSGTMASVLEGCFHQIPSVDFRYSTIPSELIFLMQTMRASNHGDMIKNQIPAELV